MEVQRKTLTDMFSSPGRYLIPLFQRPYVWSEKKQWQYLWEDIHHLVERQLSGNSLRPHFMGAVVMEQIWNSSGTLQRRLIIDGQQRLTTLQIVLEATSDVYESQGGEAANYAPNLRKLTRNTDWGITGDDAFKVWPTHVDQEQYRIVMQAQTPTTVQAHFDIRPDPDANDHLLARAYIFFYERVHAWLTEVVGAAYIQRVNAFQTILQNGLLLIVIELIEERDDAQVIFETLNARGTPLLASDLVKNYLLRQAEARGHDLDQLYAQYWEPFDDKDFWRDEIRTGRFKRPHIEVFLQYYLTLLTQDEVLVANLFNTFRQHVKDHSAVDPEHYLAELSKYGQIYHQFYMYPADTPEGIFFRRIEALDTTTVFPLLLHVFDRLAAPAHEAQRRAILGDLESFLVRRIFCKLPTKNYNNLFLAATKSLADVPANRFVEILRTFLLSQTSEIGLWPDDEMFQGAWRKLEAYKDLKPQARLRMALEALELQRRSSELTEDLSLPKKKLSIEHILPHGWEANWPLSIDTPEAKETRKSLLHTMGNLTLVTKSLNSTLSNDPWLKKRKTLQKHSVLLLNADLQDKDEWNEAEIKNRSKELFKLAKKVWLRPN